MAEAAQPPTPEQLERRAQRRDRHAVRILTDDYRYTPEQAEEFVDQFRAHLDSVTAEEQPAAPYEKSRDDAIDEAMPRGEPEPLKPPEAV